MYWRCAGSKNGNECGLVKGTAKAGRLVKLCLIDQRDAEDSVIVAQGLCRPLRCKGPNCLNRLGISGVQTAHISERDIVRNLLLQCELGFRKLRTGSKCRIYF